MKRWYELKMSRKLMDMMEIKRILILRSSFKIQRRENLQGKKTKMLKFRKN